MEKVIVTRHAALIEMLIEKGLADKNTRVIKHAKPDNIVGKHVVGVIPLSLASLAAKVTEIPLNLPVELRGKELSIEEFKRYAGEPISYVVRKI